MILAEVKRRVKGLEEGAARSVVCALVGHSRIVHLCFGEVSCARCGARIGDTLMSAFDLRKHVITGHDCKTCRANRKALDWTSTFLVPAEVAEEGLR